MSLLGIDLGATKATFAIFGEDGSILSKETILLEKRGGNEAGRLITGQIAAILNSVGNKGDAINSIGIAVPGICHAKTGTVWVPNIPGWEDYPLLAEVKAVSGNIVVTMDSDRACTILGELWKGNLRGCRDAVFLVVGTGIGAGILLNGEVLRGSHDIAGAIGWMALDGSFEEKYTSCGCFEYHASGEGMARIAREFLAAQKSYKGELRNKPSEEITSYDLFKACENNDPLAAKVIAHCIQFWGMAVANLVSLFNPEKIIIGGGVFGPGIKFIKAIREEAEKWAQPVSMGQVKIEPSALSGEAGVYGAGYLALKRSTITGKL
jgi:glucokinase